MSERSPMESPDKGDDMTPEQAAQHLRIIRQLMERPVRHTTRSGLAGIVAGALALTASVLTYIVWPAPPETSTRGIFGPSPPKQSIMTAGLIWLAVLVVAAAADILITRHRARQRGETWWKREQVQTGLAIAPGFVLAAFFTYLFAEFNSYEGVPFGWMIGYGMALWTVGMFSIVEVKVLGAAFLLAGWLGMAAYVKDWVGTSPAALHAYPVAALALTFGVFHLVYGVVVLRRHGG